MTTPPAITVVIPAYNERQTVAGVIRQVLPYCTRCIVVDDGSTDGTSEVARRAGAIVLRQVINRGPGAATITGFHYALTLGTDVVVSFDADGQHDASDIPALVGPILAGEADITLGSRFMGTTQNMPVSRRLVLRGGVVFTRIFSGMRLTDVHNGLRALSAPAASRLTLTLDGMAHASELLDEIRAHGWRCVEVPVLVRYSPYSLGKGQSVFNAVRIVFELILQRLGA